MRKLRFFCPSCKKDAVGAKLSGSSQWEKIPVHCPDCGGKWGVKVKG